MIKEFQHNPCHRQEDPHDGPFTPPAPVPPSEHPVPNHNCHPPLGTIQPGNCFWSSLPIHPPLPPHPLQNWAQAVTHSPACRNQNFSFDFQQESSEPQGGAAISGKNPNPWTEGGKKEKGIQHEQKTHGSPSQNNILEE